MSISTVQKMFTTDLKRNIFKSFIEYIRFPYYKNFSGDMKINFHFPITFLIGQNGTGKSSLLQALYGAPDGQRVSDYWFNTKLDPIVDVNTEGKRHCFIYSYRTPITKTQVEVLKTRIYKESNPDFWESAQPKTSLGMERFNSRGKHPDEASKTRWNLIKKNVHYLDFRYEISAFDKYFYFGEKPNGDRSKQDFLRQMSPYIKRAHLENTQVTYYSKSCKVPIVLSDEKLQATNEILGKKYVRGEILEHNMYNRKVPGFSIILKTDFSEYSEAFAGSGETAIVKIVHEVINASDYSLILLDEPETSLHPGAQQKLVKFLLDQIKQKKLQIVVSTHSPHIIENIPKDAIKVFYTDESNGKTKVVENIPPEEAFFYIGHIKNDKKNIIVEDQLAKMILDSVLKNMGDATNSLFEVKFHPGGESVIKNTYIPVYSKEKSSKTFVLLDGDQRRTHITVDNILEVDRNEVHLNGVIKTQTNETIPFKHDSDRIEQKIPQMLDYLRYYERNVFYLPETTPEKIIWNEAILNASDISQQEKDMILSEPDHKKKFALFANALFDESDADAIKRSHQYFLTKWVRTQDTNYNDIVSIMMRIRDI